MGNREKLTTPLEIDIDLMEDQISTMIFRIETEITAHENHYDNYGPPV